MNQSAGIVSNRIVFFDNMRSFLVVAVIVQHVCMAYGLQVWWPVSESNSSVFVMSILAIIDVFSMPLLFYVSGYFAVISISRKDFPTFMKGKLRRLGVAWVIAIVTICPVLPWVYHYTRNTMSATLPYWELWLVIMKAMGEFNVTVRESMDVLMQNNQYYLRYMWFISLLLLFFFLFAIVYKIKPLWFTGKQAEQTEKSTTVGFVVKMFLLVTFATFFGSLVLVLLMFQLSPNTSNPGSLFTLGNVIQFRPASIFTYIFYFVMGSFTYKYKWIERGLFSRHLKLWSFLFAVMLLLFMSSLVLVVTNVSSIFADIPAGDRVKIFGVINFLCRHLLLATMLGFIASLIYRYWNNETVFGQKLSAVSYYMYLSHYLIVLGLQLLLMFLPGVPSIIKFFSVALISIVITYVFSLRVIKPYPRIAALMAIGMFVTMMVFL